MPTHLLKLARERPRPRIDLLHGITMDRGRAHEACGPARRTFALWLAAQMTGPVLWIAPTWEVDQLNPDGMRDFVDPGRFLFVTAQRAEDLLWCVEEALRPGSVALIIADLPAPPALTPIRRMHLAAEQGSDTGSAPLALLLTPGQGGAQGIESRWHMTPQHQGRKRLWQLDRLRARTLPPRSWHLQQTAPGALPTPLAEKNITATG
ncbi:MAG: ImuA family protein [Paracoccaceae bacterium]